MKNHLFTIFIMIVLSAVFCQAAEMQQKHAVYVGVRKCAECHQGKGMGHQFSKWLISKHARAYAVLAKPEAKKIAELSGIPQEPQESPMCLGCHATGAHAEEWEKDENFKIENGVQCEKCHGPGSEYMEVMMDRNMAMEAGLMMPEKQDCMNCHQVKGSHVAVHNLPLVDIQKGLKSIAHPTPEKWKLSPGPSVPETGRGPRGRKRCPGWRCARGDSGGCAGPRTR